MPLPASWCRGHSKFFLLWMVLLLRCSAAGWLGLWPLRPYLDFRATGAPTLSLGVYWDIWSSFNLSFALSQTTTVVGAAL